MFKVDFMNCARMIDLLFIVAPFLGCIIDCFVGAESATCCVYLFCLLMVLCWSCSVRATPVYLY